MKFIAGILLFSIIVLFHELGHFLLAKKNGVLVHEFTLGLGPTLIGKEWHGTKYCINLIPFGGSCVMEGEDGGGNFSEGSFQSKSPWQQFQIIFAGPFFNFILAFLFSAIIIICSGASLPIVEDVMNGARAAGIQKGDRIVKLDNKRIYVGEDLTTYSFFHQDKKDVSIVFERDGTIHEVTATRTKQDGRYLVGVVIQDPVKVGPIGVITNAFHETRVNVEVVFASFHYILSGHGSIKNVSGPVGIVKNVSSIYDEAKPQGVGVIILSLMSFGAMISANLGVMNLLPLPALDGGRITMILAESIIGKKIPAKVEEYTNKAGLVFLLGLIFFVTLKDIFV